MAKIINLYGGPGAGKSTTAAGLFHKMKCAGKNVEYVSEYAKYLVWAERYDMLTDEIYIFAKQNHLLETIGRKVDYVVTDSPLLLMPLYNTRHHSSFNVLVRHTYLEYDNVNFFIKRSGEYDTSGRVQTREQAEYKDKEIRLMLEGYLQKYTIVEQGVNTVDEIYNNLFKRNK